MSDGDDRLAVPPPVTQRAPAPRRGWSWAIVLLSAAFAYLMGSRGLFSSGVEIQVGVLVGAIAALTAVSASQSVIAATGICAVAPAAVPPALPGHGSLSLFGWVLGVATAAGASYSIGVVLDRRPSRAAFLQRGIAIVLVLWIIVSLWMPLRLSGPFAGYGPLKADAIRAVPVFGEYVTDDALYRSVFHLMHEGTSYYRAYKVSWYGLAQTPPLPAAVVAYRLPTMYWLWSLLPPDAFSIEVLFLVFASIGCAAAALITGQLAGARFAPLAAVALGAYAMGSAITVYVTYIDLPTASVALVGIALFVRARITRSATLLWAAAAVMTLAALTREILAYLVVLAALAALLAPARRRFRELLPWLVSLGIFAIGYASHVLVVLNTMHATSHALSYVHGSPAFALDALRRFSDVFQAGGLVLPVLFGLGVLGAWATRRRAGWPFAAFALAALLVPVLGMMRFGNPGIDADGNEVNYWGNLFVPLALALWPAWFLVLPDGDEAHALGPNEGTPDIQGAVQGGPKSNEPAESEGL